MNCKYINHNGKEIDFLGEFSRVRSGTLHGRSWTADKTSYTVGEKVNYWKKSGTTKKLTLTCRGSRAKRLALMDEISDICEADILANTPGTLWYGDKWYCKCFIPDSSISAGDLPTWIDQEIEIYIPSATWWNEKLFSITKREASGDPVTYPTTYPFTYPTPEKNPVFTNDHFTDSDFMMIVYGASDGLNVTISGHQYKVNHQILEGEYLVIDSRDTAEADRRCYLVGKTGTITNCYNDRSGELFTKIPSGKMEIVYSRSYGIDLILLNGRSEPKWYQ